MLVVATLSWKIWIYLGDFLMKLRLFLKFLPLLLVSLLVLTGCTITASQTASVPVEETVLVETSPPVEEPTPEAVVTGSRPVEIADVQVQIGVGSPIPVEAIASGTWPDLCAQIEQVSVQFAENRFEIEISAAQADPACPPDPVGIPFRLAVPLNMVNFAYGTYTVVVNDVETAFEWTVAAEQPIPVENMGLTFAYIGNDGNLWLADASGGPPRQITSDATSPGTDGDVVSYYFPKISSDGRFIAVRRDTGVPITEGLQFEFNLWVFDTEKGEARAIFESADSPPGAFDWKPGTHLLAYGIGSDPNYFTARGEVDPSLATGIFFYDMDSGETGLLVDPETGRTLILPVWSPDGRYLGFDELVYMEGKGPFAYYDFENQQYNAWEEALGNYDWSPDGSMLVYDRLVYVPSGLERIYTRARVDGSEQQLSPESDQGYAFYPVYSPDGSQIAYIVAAGGPENEEHTVVLQDLASGERREVGVYEAVWDLDWSSDGRVLIFRTGPHEAYQIYGYDLASGEARMLVQGISPSLARP